MMRERKSYYLVNRMIEFLGLVSQNLTPHIAKDIASKCPNTKKESMLKAQQFDPIYA